MTTKDAVTGADFLQAGIEALERGAPDDAIIALSLAEIELAFENSKLLTPARIYLEDAMKGRDVGFALAPDARAMPQTSIKTDARCGHAILAILDIWGALLPVRIAMEDLADYMEDINDRLARGQRASARVRMFAAIFWTGINTVGYVARNLLGRETKGA